MKISRSAGYALLAAGYIAQQKKQSIVLSQDISGKYNIPLEYLLKILQQMVRAHILNSKRGPRGGFSMARPASKIPMIDIIEAVDGPLTGYMDIAKLSGGEKFSIRTEKAYAKAIDLAKSHFEKVKLSELIG